MTVLMAMKILKSILLFLLASQCSALNTQHSKPSPHQSAKPSKHDDDDGSKALVIEQLGYLPNNYVRVSAWKRMVPKLERSSSGTDPAIKLVPVAIQTYPLNGGAKRRRSKSAIHRHQQSSFDENTNDRYDNAKGEVESSTNVITEKIQSPFPTLFWLTCPEISKAISDLEGRGFIDHIKGQLDDDPVLRRRLLDCHREYANMRWESLSTEDQMALMAASSVKNQDTNEASNTSSFDDDDHDDKSKLTFQRMYDNIKNSGISGSVIPTDIHNGDEASVEVPNIKCLHAHYAQFRSTCDIDASGCNGDNDKISLLPKHAPSMHLSAPVPLAVNPVGKMVHDELLRRFPGLQL